MVCLNLRQIRLLEFDFRKKVKVQLYRSNIVKNVETMEDYLSQYLVLFLNCVIIKNVDSVDSTVSARSREVFKKVIV